MSLKKTKQQKPDAIVVMQTFLPHIFSKQFLEMEAYAFILPTNSEKSQMQRISVSRKCHCEGEKKKKAMNDKSGI